MLRLNEVFWSIQGEATHVGTPSLFLRLQGCPVGCVWCDTRHTWGIADTEQCSVADVMAKTIDSGQWAYISEAEVVHLARMRPVHHVVLTGGEPCMYDLRGITSALIAAGFKVQVETSGTFEVQAHPDTWVTLSPKPNAPSGMMLRPDVCARANEVKMPVGKGADIDTLCDLLHDMPFQDGVAVWLQPISQSRSATDLCIQAAGEHGWRVSIQVHKFLGLR